MWRATVLTLFPEMFPGPLGISLAGKALADRLMGARRPRHPRSATDRHRSVDDTPAGGGPGMVLRADVLAKAIDAAETVAGPAAPADESARSAIDPVAGLELAAGPGLLIVCGRFEGVDQRVIEARGLEEVSIGDYVLSGGEIAAMALIDACVRLLPGVMGKAESGADESFSRRASGISPVHPPAGLRGPADPGRSAVRRPRQGRRPGGGRGGNL